MDKKSRIGDLEGDTVSGKNHQGFLVTLADRRSRFSFCSSSQYKRGFTVAEAIIEMLRPHKQLRHTITFDNGQEFAQHQYIAKALDASVYFAHPYCS